MKTGNFLCHDLRAIGQALETRRISTFELKKQDSYYTVRGKPERDRSLFAILTKWRRMGRVRDAVTVTITPPDIERLDRQGTAKRAKADRLPDFYSVSNTLRTIGSYLDLKGAQLLEIHKGVLSVTMLYEDNEGHPKLEERTVASFYNLFVALHGQRGKRHAT